MRLGFLSYDAQVRHSRLMESEALFQSLDKISRKLYAAKLSEKQQKTKYS